MSDCEETDLFWESCIWTPAKGKKKKKDPKGDKKHKHNKVMKTNDNSQKKKKKKNSKFKEAMEERKQKRKGKKKKRLGDGFTVGSSSHLQLDQDRDQDQGWDQGRDQDRDQDRDQGRDQGRDQDRKKRKSQKNKKVVFDLSAVSVKRLKSVSLYQGSPRDRVLLEDDAQIFPQIHNRAQNTANESQCTSEDMNSQDLFITQKTFRASPSEPSSTEASAKAVPYRFTPQDQLHTSGLWMKQHLEGSHKDSRSHQHHGKTVQVPLRQEEEEEAHPKKGKSSFQTQVESLTEKEMVSGMVSPYLCDSVDVNPLDVAKSQKHSCASRLASMETSSTQTENFFTTELCSYLSFCHTSKVTVHPGDLKPLDLSLPQKSRKDLSAKALTLPELISHKDSDMEYVNKELSGPGPRPVSPQGQREAVSPQSESEAKSTDMTTSSEDEPPCRTGKLDMTQVRAVQMRLNESFFFKTKGERKSPRPESPLMKLVQGQDQKSRKHH